MCTRGKYNVRCCSKHTLSNCAIECYDCQIGCCTKCNISAHSYRAFVASYNVKKQEKKTVNTEKITLIEKKVTSEKTDDTDSIYSYDSNDSNEIRRTLGLITLPTRDPTKYILRMRAFGFDPYEFYDIDESYDPYCLK